MTGCRSTFVVAARVAQWRTISWLLGYWRLTIRYERKAVNFAAFLSLAATLTCR